MLGGIKALVLLRLICDWLCEVDIAAMGGLT